MKTKQALSKASHLHILFKKYIIYRTRYTLKPFSERKFVSRHKKTFFFYPFPLQIALVCPLKCQQLSGSGYVAERDAFTKSIAADWPGTPTAEEGKSYHPHQLGDP